MEHIRFPKLFYVLELTIALCFCVAIATPGTCTTRQLIAGASSPGSQYQPPNLRPAIHTPDSQVVNQLESIAKSAKETEGALFVKEDEVTVKAPMLKALIELHRGLSPYDLDANGSRSITLREVLVQALGNNLDITISNSDMQSSRWMFISSLGNFLPTIINAVSYQSLSGSFASPFGAVAPVNSAFLTMPSGFAWNIL